MKQPFWRCIDHFIHTHDPDDCMEIRICNIPPCGYDTSGWGVINDGMKDMTAFNNLLAFMRRCKHLIIFRLNGFSRNVIEWRLLLHALAKHPIEILDFTGCKISLDTRDFMHYLANTTSLRHLRLENVGFDINWVCDRWLNAYDTILAGIAKNRSIQTLCLSVLEGTINGDTIVDVISKHPTIQEYVGLQCDEIQLARENYRHELASKHILLSQLQLCAEMIVVIRKYMDVIPPPI